MSGLACVHIDIYTTVCKTDNQWGAAIECRELSSGLCDDLDGWDGVGVGGGGREVPEGEIYVYI